MLRKVLPVLILAVASAMAHAEKISGFVKGAPKGKTFIVGSKKGEFTVDASKAKVRLNGKFFSVDKLTAGSQVNVEGAIKGKHIAATAVDIGNLRGAGKIPAKGDKPASKPPKTIAPPKGKH